jgi:chloride channel protein, CIC family
MAAEDPAPAPDPLATMRSRRFIVLLVLASLVGVVASIVAWAFLELLHGIQQFVYTDLPQDLGFDSAPRWWSLPVLAIAGVITAFAIARLPGRGGHVPANGLNPAPTRPIEVPGVMLAALAGVGLGVVLGPEAPLIAMGGALGLLTVDLLRRDVPDEVGALMAASATLAALSFLFGSPLIAAVIIIEVAGLGGTRLPLVLIPGLLASGIGSLVWIGLGSFTGLSTSDISISLLKLPAFSQPDIADFGWTILLAAAVAIVTFVIFRLAAETQRFAARRPFLVLPIVGVAVAGLAIGFSEAADKSVSYVLFSGQDSIGPLVSSAGSWSLSALALVIVFKGVAYGLSLGSFRGGPTFPAMFLGAAGGVMAAKLPGFDLTPAVGVGIAAGVASVLRLPLSATLLGVLFTESGGPGASPLIIVGVVVAYLVTIHLGAGRGTTSSAPATSPAPPAPAARVPT